MIMLSRGPQFPIQTIPSNGVLTTTQWQEVERMAKSTIQERKIRVNYLPAESPERVNKEGSPNGIVCSIFFFFKFRSTLRSMAEGLTLF